MAKWVWDVEETTYVNLDHCIQITIDKDASIDEKIRVTAHRFLNKGNNAIVLKEFDDYQSAWLWMINEIK
jgi:hypothetical protein